MSGMQISTAQVAVIGVTAVTAYAGLAALQILVLNPLAAAPGSSLDAIYAEMDAAGETMPVTMPLLMLGAGVAAAITVAVLSIRSRLAPAHSALLFLLLLILRTPGYFVASFGPGMNLADAFMISGGDHSRWSLVLHAVSLGAAAAAVVLALRMRRRRPLAVKA